MQKKYTVSSSPHLRDNVSTRRVMQDVCIALIPAGLAGVWFFGLRAAILIAVSVVSAVFSEWFYCKHAKRGNPIGDFSAVVTGLLVAYNLPASAPWWLAAIGSAIAIIPVSYTHLDVYKRQLHGGGKHFFRESGAGAQPPVCGKGLRKARGLFFDRRSLCDARLHARVAH